MSKESKKEVFCENCGFPIEEDDPFFERENGEKVHRSVDCLLDEFASAMVFIMEFPYCIGCEKPINISSGDLLIAMEDGVSFCHHDAECMVKAIEKGE